MKLSKKNSDLKKRCQVANEAKSFIGISYKNNVAKVTFPISYKITDDEKKLKREILNLVKILSLYKDDDELNSEGKKEENFPFLAYQIVIFDYLKNGSYKEFERIYKVGKSGKINFAQTIKKIQPIISRKNIIYTDLIMLNTKYYDEKIINEIYKFCVYESIEKIGFLYALPQVSKSNLNIQNSPLYVKLLRQKLSKTYNDDKKKLINSMIEILDFTSNTNKLKKVKFGTNAFANIYEKLVDKAFNNVDKREYYPNSFWYLCDGKDIYKQKFNSNLRPDSIMKFNNEIFILDSKYYRYGIGYDNLPQTADINKQVAYAEYILKTNITLNEIIEQKPNLLIYNAFILPHSGDKFKIFGYAERGWQNTDENYEKIIGIFIDINCLLNNNFKQPDQNILANLIRGFFGNSLKITH